MPRILYAKPCGRSALYLALLALVIFVAGCASMPMPEDARGPNGERLPDLCYQWTWSGQTKALMCHPAPKQ